MQPQTPETLAVKRENSALLWRTVWTMPSHLRCVITQLYICDRSFEEAAQLMGLTYSAVQLLHDKAIANLRSRISLWQSQ